MQYNKFLCIVVVALITWSNNIFCIINTYYGLKNFHVVTPYFQYGFYPILQGDMKNSCNLVGELSGEKVVSSPKLQHEEVLKASTESQSKLLLKKLQQLDALYFAKMVEYENVTKHIDSNVAWKNNYNFALMYRAQLLKKSDRYKGGDEDSWSSYLKDPKIDKFISSLQACDDSIKKYTPQKLEIEKSLHMLQDEIYSVERSFHQYEDLSALQEERLFEQLYTVLDCEEKLRSTMLEHGLYKKIDNDRRVRVALACAERAKKNCA